MVTKIYIYIIILLIIAIIAIILYFKIRKRYTRERYAFFYIKISASLILGVIDALTTNFIIQALNWCIINLGKKPIPDANMSDFQMCSIVALVSGFLIIGYLIFVNWNGPKSIREKNNYEVNHKLLYALYYYFKYDDSKKLYKPNITPLNLPQEDIKRKEEYWHLKAARLLNCWDKRFRINELSDWQNSHNFFISNYGLDKYEKIGIGCFKNKEFDVKELVITIQSYLKRQDIKVFVAIEDSDIYQSQNIENAEVVFIGKEYLLDHLINKDIYTSKIKQEYCDKVLYTGSEITIDKIYTESPCVYINHEEKSDGNIDSIEKYILNWLEDCTQQQQLAILGQYGQGKSVLSLRLAYLMLCEGKSKRIPIIVKLGGIFPKGNISAALLASWCHDNHIGTSDLLDLHSEGRLLLIFDGFDEMMLAGTEEMQRECFGEIWKFSTPKSKIIITGRENFFIDNIEMNIKLRSSKNDNSYCIILKLQNFKRNQIENALRNEKNKKRKEILSAYDRSGVNGSFADLISRPSLLSITGWMWNKITKDSTKDINSAYVINRYLQACYERENEKTYKNYDNIVLGANERAYFMQGIAVAMSKINIFSNWIDSNSLEKIVIKLYQNIPDEISRMDLQESLKTRLTNKHGNEASWIILNDVRSCGILIRDISSDVFRFSHKSFFEVLVANHFATGFVLNTLSENLESITYKSLSNIFEVNQSSIYKNSQILRFTAEEISNKLKWDKQTDDNTKIHTLYKCISKRTSFRFAINFMHAIEFIERHWIAFTTSTLLILFSIFTSIIFLDIMTIYKNIIYKAIIVFIPLTLLPLFKKKYYDKNDFPCLYFKFKSFLGLFVLTHYFVRKLGLEMLYIASKELGLEKKLLEMLPNYCGKHLRIKYLFVTGAVSKKNYNYEYIIKEYDKILHNNINSQRIISIRTIDSKKSY